MKSHKLVAVLRGGIGNQLFQYAAASAVAKRSGFELVLDTQSGFVRDKTYQRYFSLSDLTPACRTATISDKSIYWSERLISKSGWWPAATLIRRRPWGLFIGDGKNEKYEHYLSSFRPDRDVWMDGYWQSEQYFLDFIPKISQEIRIKTAIERKYESVFDGVDRSNCVAVGVRLYEETPLGQSSSTPFSFYETAARKISSNIRRPIFFIFCTVRTQIDSKLKLPGEIRYITRDDGYANDLQSLWLFSQFKHFVISNSSFYWWGAWLAERDQPAVNVIASNLFSNKDCIPNRWTRI